MQTKITMALAGLFAGAALHAQETRIESSALPKEASSFLTQHFGDNTIRRAVKDTEGSRHTFEVRLTDGTEIEFNSDGSWHEIDGNGKVVPASLIPNAIADYTTRNYPQAKITKIERSSRRIDIDLDNGTELEFDSNGKFLRIDR